MDIKSSSISSDPDSQPSSPQSYVPSQRSLHACLVPFSRASLHGQGGTEETGYGVERWVIA